jgi:hypothetical protein
MVRCEFFNLSCRYDGAKEACDGAKEAGLVLTPVETEQGATPDRQLNN